MAWYATRVTAAIRPCVGNPGIRVVAAGSLLAAQVLDPCPPSESCGGTVNDDIQNGYGSSFTNPNASICYPDT